jgi:predicted MFS family arabinose efflux permease
MSEPIERSTYAPLSAMTRGVRNRERWLLFTLAAIQFVHVLDSLIVMPLGPEFMRDLGLNPAMFGVLVSAYSLSAAAAGLAGAFVLDRFDRKYALVSLFLGLVAATFMCGIAKDFHILIAGRILSGACGGLIQALLFTIIGDCFPDARRGHATGLVISSYSIATVLGVPAALFLAGQGNWSLPFIVLSAIGFVVFVASIALIPQMKGHLHHATRSERALEKGSMKSPFLALILKQNSRLAFLMVITLMFAGFTVIPYMSTYLASNLGLSHKVLATVFFTGGVATFSTARWVGRLSDRFGKLKMFTWLALASAFPTLILTHAKPMSMVSVLFVTTPFILLIAARGIPSLALITASVGPGFRGRFLSLTSSLQQASSGFASLLTGLFLSQAPDGHITNYNWAGDLSVVFILCSVLVANRLRPVGSQSSVSK